MPTSDSNDLDTSEQQITQWLDNFEPSERTLMDALVRRLKLYTRVALEDLLLKAFDKLFRQHKFDPRNALYLGIGDSGADSGKTFCYALQKARRLPDACFPLSLEEAGAEALQRRQAELSDRRTKPKSCDCKLVLLDDFLGSGNQCITFFKENINQLNQRLGAAGVALTKDEVFYVAAIGSETAMERIRKTTMDNGFPLEHIYCGQILDASSQAFSAESGIWQSEAELRRAKDIARKYGEQLWPDHPLGKGEGQYLIRFELNVPHNTLPIIWQNKDNLVVSGKAPKEFKAIYPRIDDEAASSFANVIARFQEAKESERQHVARHVSDLFSMEIANLSHGQKRLLRIIRQAKSHLDNEQVLNAFISDKPKSSPPTVDEIRFRLHVMRLLGLVNFEKRLAASGSTMLDKKRWGITPLGEKWSNAFSNNQEDL